MSHSSNSARFFIVASHHYWLESRLDRRTHLQQEDALIGFENEGVMQDEEQREYASVLEA